MGAKDFELLICNVKVANTKDKNCRVKTVTVCVVGGS
jgi:hypothetical protein